MLSKATFAAILLLWDTAGAQSLTSSPGQNATEITSVTTSGDSTITAIYTPASLNIDGLVPPIAAATTITSVDSAGETVAVAVAAGAGVVAGGGLAAWLFKPVPGALPAPTQPPPYSTEPQGNEPTPTSAASFTFTTITTSTSSQASPACPFPSSGFKISFVQVEDQPQWTVAIPSASTVSSYAPECTQQGGNNELLRGTDPGYIGALAESFCKGDLSDDQTAVLGQADLDDNNSWKTAKLDSIRVKFGFSHAITNDACAENCIDAFEQIGTRCQYNSHILYGSGTLKQGCGDYSLEVDADPITKLTCNPVPDPIWGNYQHRDSAIAAVKDFCRAQGGSTLKQGDESTDIKETPFAITYTSDCKGSGSYNVSEDTCIKYLTETIDSCNTDTTMYKHGGIVTDQYGCAAFAFQPTGVDSFACYLKNKDANYITQGRHATISPEMAHDAIEQFCDRKGEGQTYTLDPDNIPNSSDFTGNTCTENGMAACAYYYEDNGNRATGDSIGSVVVRMNAQYMNPANGLTCGPNVQYDIQGDRCRQQLGKVIGLEPQGQCVGSDPSQLDLGTFIENGDKGCVLWNMWAVQTTG